jgi:hypothetical protein
VKLSPNKPLVRTRNGEAPSLAAQRRRYVSSLIAFAMVWHATPHVASFACGGWSAVVPGGN